MKENINSLSSSVKYVNYNGGDITEYNQYKQYDIGGAVEGFQLKNDVYCYTHVQVSSSSGMPTVSFLKENISLGSYTTIFSGGTFGLSMHNGIQGEEYIVGYTSLSGGAGSSEQITLFQKNTNTISELPDTCNLIAPLLHSQNIGDYGFGTISYSTSSNYIGLYKFNYSTKTLTTIKNENNQKDSPFYSEIRSIWKGKGGQIYMIDEYRFYCVSGNPAKIIKVDLNNLTFSTMKNIGLTSSQYNYCVFCTYSENLLYILLKNTIYSWDIEKNVLDKFGYFGSSNYEYFILGPYCLYLKNKNLFYYNVSYYDNSAKKTIIYNCQIYLTKYSLPLMKGGIGNFNQRVYLDQLGNNFSEANVNFTSTNLCWFHKNPISGNFKPPKEVTG